MKKKNNKKNFLKPFKLIFEIENIYRVTYNKRMMIYYGH